MILHDNYSMSKRKGDLELFTVQKNEKNALNLKKQLRWRLGGILVVLCLGLYSWPFIQRLKSSSKAISSRKAFPLSQSKEASGAYKEEVCPQYPPWKPPNGSIPLPTTPSPMYLAELLSGAVKIDTSVFDDFPLPVDSQPDVWQRAFGPFQEYLRKAFPDIHSSERIQLEVVNRHGLIYTWKGKNENLKPLIFMAHQDVVPVDPSSTSKWDHDPFSGYIDVEKGLVYGRGASDDKASLVSLLASISSLHSSDFVPQRTVILSFGFDEEASGTQGAKRLALRLKQLYGSHKEGGGAYMIVDEGEGVQSDLYGFAVASPAVAEKGYLDVRITVRGQGGHSSEPPKHTTIGILSRIVSQIEENVWSPTMKIREDAETEQDSPGLETLLCLRNAPGMVGTPVGRALKNFITARSKHSWDAERHHRIRSSKKSLDRYRQYLLQALQNTGQDSAFTTTQAVDLISGGVKVNALPEEATAVINHRISADGSVQEVRSHILEVIRPLADQYGFIIKAWGQSNEDEGAYGNKATVIVTLEDAFDSALDVAPRTPTHGKDAGPYRLLSSVIRYCWHPDNSRLSIKQREYLKQSQTLRGDGAILVAPTLMEGNTDTHSYWDLTRHIFRFSPGTLTPMDPHIGNGDGNIHTVNEVVQIDSLVSAFNFYTTLILAAQT